MKNDYEVGYGKPPVATQFVKGQSGNPEGRPRRARVQQEQTSLADDLSNELQQLVTITGRWS